MARSPQHRLSPRHSPQADVWPHDHGRQYGDRRREDHGRPVNCCAERDRAQQLDHQQFLPGNLRQRHRRHQRPARRKRHHSESDSGIAIWDSRRDSNNITVENKLIVGGGFSVYAEDYSPSEASPQGDFQSPTSGSSITSFRLSIIPALAIGGSGIRAARRPIIGCEKAISSLRHGETSILTIQRSTASYATDTAAAGVAGPVIGDRR